MPPANRLRNLFRKQDHGSVVLKPRLVAQVCFLPFVTELRNFPSVLAFVLDLQRITRCDFLLHATSG